MTKKKPLIALTPYFNIERDEPYMRPAYLKAIRAAGGTPLILPLDLEEEDLQQVVDTFDGFLFTGGPDIHPFFFDEETQENCGNVCLRRDRMEMALLKLVTKTGKPVLGICRGIQSLNVALGGTLWQDLPSQHPSDIEHHMNPPYDAFGHNVSLVPGTPLASLFAGQTEIAVNSYHHQAVREPAAGLEVMAVAPDGVIEALYRPASHFLWAVQWHPEFLYKVDPRSQAIFDAFVGSCR